MADKPKKLKEIKSEIVILKKSLMNLKKQNPKRLVMLFGKISFLDLVEL